MPRLASGAAASRRECEAENACGVSSCFHAKQRSLKSPLVAIICEVVSKHQFHSISIDDTCLYRLLARAICKGNCSLVWSKNSAKLVAAYGEGISLNIRRTPL